VVANRGKRVIAFTHKPVLPDTPVAASNRRMIAAANTVGFTSQQRRGSGCAGRTGDRTRRHDPRA